MFNYMRPCPGCGAPIGPTSPMCGDCAQDEARKAQIEEAALTEWAETGIAALESFLMPRAAFIDWLEEHHYPLV